MESVTDGLLKNLRSPFLFCLSSDCIRENIVRRSSVGPGQDGKLTSHEAGCHDQGHTISGDAIRAIGRTYK